MNKLDIYSKLESRMLSYTDYATVPVIDNNESLVPILSRNNLSATQYRTEMLQYTGDQVYVRRTVARQLGVAAALLALRDDSLQLEVCYGYRSPEIQKKNFEKEKERLARTYEGDELLAMTHKLVAVPEVAGHPAGAAVDLRICREGTALSFGTDIWEFVPDSYTFSPFIDKEARRNRLLLRNAMLAAGFAPFDGEWWHFSYGDKEWARYYDMPFAQYGQVEFRTVEEPSISELEKRCIDRP